MGILDAATSAERAGAVTERAVVFGSHGGLVGVVTLPAAAGTGEAPRRALVMANIGVMHHVGPFRLYVELAREAAALGWCALRFDLSGLGDSAPRPGAQASGEQAQADVVEALDWLERAHGVREVVLVGLCSGVDTVHPVAVVDPRVVGAVFVDGYTYPTLGFHVRRHTLRYLQLERWQRFLRRRIGRLRTGARTVVPDDAGGPVFEREYPTRQRFRDEIARIAARGSRLLFVFTGTFDGVFNGESQMREILGRVPPSPAMDVALLRGADHLFADVEHRRLFFARVSRWLAAFPPAPMRRP